MVKRITIPIAAVVFVAFVALLGAADLGAQGGDMHGHRADSMPRGMMGEGMMGGGSMGPGMMGPGMMQTMGGMEMMATGGPGPAMLLRMREALDLTDEQVTRLEELREGSGEQIHGQMTTAMQARREALEILDREAPDFAAYERVLERAFDAMVGAHVTMARAAVEARDVLTPEQRGELEGTMKMMRGTMGAPDGMGDGAMPGGRMDGGMMRGHR